MTNWTIVNRNNVTKAVFFVLQKYHRLHGLIVHCWSKPPGSFYFSFCSAAVRDPLTGGVFFRPGPVREGAELRSLTIYQDRLGMPAWDQHNGHKSHPDWEKQKIDTWDMVNWIEKHLNLDVWLDSHAPEISRWRETYHVDQSEKYLLTWNLVGLYASQRNEFIHNLWSEQMRDYLPRDIPALQKLLGLARTSDHVFSVDRWLFATYGRAVGPNRRVYNFWEDFLEGMSPEEILQRFLEVDGVVRAEC